MSNPTQLPETAETYVKRIRERANNPVAEVNQSILATKQTDIQSIQMETQKTEAEARHYEAQAKLEEVKNKIKKPSENKLASLFVDKTPEEIKNLLKSLTVEDIQTLNLIMNSDNPVNTALMMRQQQQQPQQQNSFNEKILETLLKVALENKQQPPPPQPAPPAQNQSLDFARLLEGLAKYEEARRPVQAPAPQGLGSSPLDVLKLVLEVTKPLNDQLKGKDKELIDAKLKEMEAKMPPSLEDQISYVKNMAPLLGLGHEGTNELDLKLEEMKQNREIDLKRLEWEQNKYEMEQEADGRKWEQISKILQGPVGEVVKNLGTAGADRVRGQRNQNPNPASGVKIPKPVQTQCPNCNEPIFVDAEAETAICGHCGAILQKQAGAAPPTAPEPAPTTHVKEQPEAHEADEASKPTSEPVAEAPEQPEEITEEEEQAEEGQPEQATE